MSYAEYDYDSDDDYYELEGDYIWAEDGSWELADELASGAIPDPPALYYREDEWEEHDKYDFWSELEYGNGDIYDGEAVIEEGATPNKAGDKRKRSNVDGADETIKRTKLAGIQDYPTVLWKSTCESFSLRPECPLYKKPQNPYSLLPDWRERFKDAPRFATPTQSELPPAKDDDSEGQEEEMGDWEDMDEEDEESHSEEEDMDEGVDLQDIDPEMLRTALAAKLSSSGLAGADQAVFMESLMKMVSGESGGDPADAVESLTSTLLNQVSQSADSSAAQWLAGQGVSLEDDEDEEDDDGHHKNESASTSTNSLAQDSVAAKKPATTKSSAAMEDTAPTNGETTGKKRKQVSFEPATSQPEAAVLDPAPSTKRVKKATTDTIRAPVTVPMPAKLKSATPQSKANKTNEIKALKASEPTKSTKSQAKAIKADTPEVSDGIGSTKTTRSQAKMAKPEEAPSKTEAPKQTRKRKATTEAASEEKPKRQLRNFAAPTASSQSKTAESKTAETKTMRSGKARK